MVLAAVFWIATNSNRIRAEPDWARLVGDAGSWRVLPLLVLALCAGLLLAERWAEARYVLLAVTGAGVLMYAARVVLQAVGADDDGGRLSDYPSGHTAATTAFVGALTALIWSRSTRADIRALSASAAAAVVVVMSWARVEGGEHSVVDVVGGVALAVGWLSLCLLVAPPTNVQLLSRRHVSFALLAFGLAGFVLLAVLYDHEPLTTLDVDLANRVAERMPAWVEVLARPFSWLGGWIGLTVLGVVTVVVLVRARAFSDLVFLLVAFVGSQLVVALLKDGFDRPRPHAGSALPLPESAAFPSGHATAGAASVGALAVLLVERLPSARGRALLWSAAIVLGIAVGLSRIALNVHFVTDVVAGWCLGLAWLGGCLLLRDLVRGHGDLVAESHRAGQV